MIKTKLILDNKFKLVKDAFERPKLYLSDHFIDLKSKVDIAYAKQQNVLSSNSSALEILNVNWQETIDKINLFEKDCLNFRNEIIFSNELGEIVKTSINDIENRLLQFEQSKKLNEKEEDDDDDEDQDEDDDDEDDDDYDEDESFKQISDLIYSLLIQIEKVLFKNKTMVFLVKRNIPVYKRYSCLSEQYPNAHSHENIDLFKSLDEKKAGLLIFATDEYCGTRATRLFKKLAFYDTKITREKALCKQLKQELNRELKNNHIYETQFRNFKSFDLSRSSEEISRLDAYGKRVQIDFNVFNGLELVEYVCLANNSLYNLRPNIFESLINVEQLNLSSCNLTRLDVGVFNGLVNLKELFLFHNEFSSINADAFSGLTNVELIELTSCKNLSYVNGEAFRGLNKLVKINMGFCALKTIDLIPFKKLPSLKCLVLHIKGLRNGKQNEYQFDIC
jgi:hypothetical protein